MNKVTMRGAAAEVRWGYQKAASLSSWTFDRTNDGQSHVEATIDSSDALRLSQSPLVFVVKRPKGPAWVWPVESSQSSGDTWSATLGSPKE